MLFKPLVMSQCSHSNGQNMSRPNTKSRGKEIFSSSSGVEGNRQSPGKGLRYKGGGRKWGYQCNLLYYTHPNQGFWNGAGILASPLGDSDAC